MSGETTAQERNEIEGMMDGLESLVGITETYIHRLKDKLKPVINTTPRPEETVRGKTKAGCSSPLGQGLFVFKDRLESVNRQLEAILSDCVL